MSPTFSSLLSFSGSLHFLLFYLTSHSGRVYAAGEGRVGGKDGGEVKRGKEKGKELGGGGGGLRHLKQAGLLLKGMVVMVG